MRRKQNAPMVDSNAPLASKRYGHARLYHPGGVSYRRLGELAAMVEREEEFVVHDAQTGEDITRSVLKSIIIEQARHG